MEQTTNRERYLALSRMCLNNWHYIDRKILSFHEEINFFTGHSGSGKSTIIDALQIVLYANTDGRGFFNKAAAEDSDRSLIEYLRGMVNIGDNNESAYLRNKNFSTTIVLEFSRSDTKEKQCVGVVFDVETATNEISRYFFWHRGEMLQNHYRIERRPMSTEELKEYLVRTMDKADYYINSRNESFRRRLYDDILGGLDREKFPMLFKRAIPFKMNSKLEDFVKEYICMEQDIYIEEMQESVMQYGRMQKKIMDIIQEIRELTDLGEKYLKVEEKQRELTKYAYFAGRFEILEQQEKLKELEQKEINHQKDLEGLKEKLAGLDKEKADLSDRKEELIRLIAETGYQEAVDQLRSLNQLLERMDRSRARWDETADRLKAWADNDMASNAILWNIERFVACEIEKEQIEELKAAIAGLMEDVSAEKEDLDGEIRTLRRELKKTREDLSELHKGSKVYPREITEARQYVYQGLVKRLGKAVRVEILADLIDIREERWRNAVEGYMGGNRLLLIVEPKYAKEAMEIYRELDSKKYYRAAVLDTEKILEREHITKENALSEAVKAREPHVRSYLDYLMGNVIKCDTLEEMRQYPVAVLDDCTLYQGYRLSHMNPKSYTREACIGAESLKRRIALLKKQAAELESHLKPREEQQREYETMLSMERLSKDTAEYMEWLLDIQESKAREKEKERLTRRILKLQQKDVARLKMQREEIEAQLQKKEEQFRKILEEATRLKQTLETEKQARIDGAYFLTQLEKEFAPQADLDEEAAGIAFQENRLTYEQLKRRCLNRRDSAREEKEQRFQKLAEERGSYLKAHPNRSFKQFSQDNAEYDKLLDDLQFHDLERFQALAKEQAKAATQHFQNDFIYKIRSAIKDAMERKNELNKIIDKLDFGKDKYKFIFGRNRGEDGKYYDMFMDKSLEINPSQLGDAMDNQMNLFSMEHNGKYGAMLKELMTVFIPPVDASAEEQEEAKRNMEKYADYRTYLSFDMQQIIEGEHEPIKLNLSKMIKKNSGGEGQNPLYVALLASFAQAYRINMPARLLRKPSIRLVVLDEAFSKMDGEKVASCISLIRSLGFQVIISATNDKIQNYLENVDKIFVFANPNKKSISIQEFEKHDFNQLQEAE